MRTSIMLLAMASALVAAAAEFTFDMTDAEIECGVGGTVRRATLAKAPSDFSPSVGDALTFRLFDGATNTLTLVREEAPVMGRRVFTAKPERGDSVALVMRPDGFSVSFADAATGRTYVYSEMGGVARASEIARDGVPAQCGNGELAAEISDASAAESVAAPAAASSKAARSVAAKRLSASAATAVEYEKVRKIRLLFVFDANAVDYLYSENADYLGFAASAVVRMNKVLENSKLDEYFTYEFAGATLISARDSNISTAYSVGWGYMTGSGADAWAGVLEERAATRADIVVALIDTGSSGGVTGLSHPYTGTTAEYAKDYAGNGFCVCSVRTAQEEVAGSLGAFQVLSHEVAHTIGCGHSDTQDFQSSPQSAAYSFGYQFKMPPGKSAPLAYHTSLNGEYACTVMAYKERFFKYEDGSYMSLADALAETGWTTADDRELYWDNTSGEYGNSYGAGVFCYCHFLPYFSSPEYYLVDYSSSGGAVTVSAGQYASYTDEWKAMCVPMGDAEKHDNRQVLLNNYQYASRWHLGVEISKTTAGTVVNGRDDKITLVALSDGATIYYTTDGTEPTAENGTKYEAPFSLSASATVKARAYDSTGDAGDVAQTAYTLSPIGVALGDASLSWTQNEYPWIVEDDGTARSRRFASNEEGGESILSTTITGPATISFDYRIISAEWSMGDFADHFTVSIDGEAILSSENKTVSDWTSVAEKEIGEGEHTLAFSFLVGEYWGDSYAAVRNVSVVYDESEDPDPPEPPAVIPGTVSFEETTQWNVALDEAKEWAVVGDKPIFFTIPSCTNVFTVAFDADIPDAAGTVFGFLPSTSSAKGDYVSLRRDADDAFYGAYKSTSKFTDADASFFASAAALSSGGHRITVTYDYRNGTAPLSIRGTSASVDDALFYHSKGLSFSASDRVVSLFSIGGAAVESTPTDVLAGLKVKNLTVIPGMFKDQATGADRLATVNGVAAKDAAKNLELVRMFGLSPDAAEVAFTIDGIDASAMTLDATVSPPIANGTLSVQGRESLASPWIRAKVWHGPGASAGKVSLSDDDLSPYRFFRLSAEPGSYGKGSEAAD